MAAADASSNPSPQKHSSFEDDHLDLPLAVSQPSMISASLDLGKSILLSRPFLLAVIFFLAYRVWFSGKASKPNVVSVDKSSVSGIDRTSLRRSLRAPSVTMASKHAK